MGPSRRRRAVVAFSALLGVATLHARQSPDQTDNFKFKSGVDLINVTATITDAAGRFVPGLTRDDFDVYEDDVLQTVTHFSAERVPVSLGIVLDTSGSMEGIKLRAARSALEQFLDLLSDTQDEFFLYQFNEHPTLLLNWTRDRAAVSHALSRIKPDGGTALYDAVAQAVPLVASGRNTKKALVVISDGNDTSSITRMEDLQSLIRETEALVYAVGIDGPQTGVTVAPVPKPPSTPVPRFPVPRPFPRPPGGGLLRSPQWQWPAPRPSGSGTSSGSGAGNTDAVNTLALRRMTDDSGGRTVVIRDTRDLSQTTAGIADELSRQYYLGYPTSSKRDGRWHAIRVEVRKGNYRVRARRGYVAS